MKKIYRIIAMMACAVFFFSSFPGGHIAEASQIETIEVIASGDSLKDASEQARKKGVQQVLSYLLDRSQAGAQQKFERLLAGYSQYTGSVNIVQKKTQGGKTFLKAKVPVDVQKIQDSLSSSIQKVQERNGLQEACFLIRVTGIPEHDAQIKEREVLDNYADIYGGMGFEVDKSDTILNYADKASVSRMPYEEYKARMHEFVANNVNITLAIIGSVDITSVSKDDAGVLKKGNVHVEAFSAQQNINANMDNLAQSQTQFKKIAEFQDEYLVKDSDENKAVTAILEKAAVNSARTLGNAILSAWS